MCTVYCIGKCTQTLEWVTWHKKETESLRFLAIFRYNSLQTKEVAKCVDWNIKKDGSIFAPKHQYWCLLAPFCGSIWKLKLAMISLLKICGFFWYSRTSKNLIRIDNIKKTLMIRNLFKIRLWIVRLVLKLNYAYFSKFWIFRKSR